MRRLFRGVVATLGYGLVTVVVAAAALLAVARLLLPAVDTYRMEVEAWASDQLGQPVRIGALNAELLGLHPTIVLEDVALLDQKGRRDLARFDEARIEIDPVASWRRGTFVTGGLGLVGAELTAERGPDGGFRLRGVERPKADTETPTVGGLAGWLLAQSDLSVTDSRLVWVDDGRRRLFRNVNLHLHNEGERHRLSGSVALPPGTGGTLRVAVDARGDVSEPQAWQGRGYLAVDRLQPLSWGGLPTFEGLRLERGAVDLELWGRWRQGGPRSLKGEVGFRNALVAGADGRELALTEARTRLDWQAREEGWRLDLDRLRLEDGPAMRLAIEEGPEGGRLLADRLDLTRLARFAGLGDWLQPAQRQALEAMAPQGALQDLRLDWSAQAFAVQGRVEGLRLEPWQQLPGVRDLDARFRGDRRGGKLTLTGSGTELRLPRLFRQPLAFERLLGTVAVRRTDEGWAVAAHDVELANDDIQVGAGMRLRLPRTGAPFLDLRATFDQGRGTAIPRYLPAHVMDEEGLAWLDRAFEAGRVSDGRLLFHGRVDQFPFDGNEGRFDIRFRADDVGLDYHPEWPDLKAIDGTLLFDGVDLTVRVERAGLFGHAIHDTVVRIPDLRDPVVRVDGRSDGPVADLLRLVEASPLEAEVGRFTEELAADGNARLGLDLVLPVDDDAREKGIERRVAGRVNFDGARLYVGDSRIELAGLKGELGFDQDGLHAEGITAEIFGRPATLDVAPQRSRGVKVTQIRARGGAEPGRLADTLEMPLLDRVHGEVTWRGALEFPHEARAAGVLLQLQTNLKQTRIDLPPPAAKAAGVERELGLSLFLSGDREGEFWFTYGEIASGAVELDGGRPRRAELAFAGSATLPAEEELRITGRLENADLAAWAGIWQGAAGGGDGDRGEDRPLPPLVISMDRLHIAAAEGAGGGDNEGLKRLSGLDATVERFGYGEMDFGRLRLVAESAPGGMRVRRLMLDGPFMKADASGRWNFGLGRSHTRFEFEVTSPNMGRMMDELGFISVITEGEMRVRGELSWPGTPASVALKRLNGTMQVRIKDGTIKEVKPGAPGRLLGLLSVRALPRRLSLDFRDLFEKGLRFKKIHGDLELEQGVGYTDNLQVEARNALAIVQGRTDLVERRLDQEITVIPDVSGSLPLAGGLALGPQVGAALWLLQKVIKPGLEKVIRYTYRVTGTFDDPEVELVAGGPDDDS